MEGCDARALERGTAGAFVYCRRLGQGENSDQFGQKAIQAYRSALGFPKTEAVSEAHDARSLSVVRNRRGARAREFWDAERAEERYDDLDLGDDIRSLLRLLERMSRDGMNPVAWTDSYVMRKEYGDRDRSQHELRRIASWRWLFSTTNST